MQTVRGRHARRQGPFRTTVSMTDPPPSQSFFFGYMLISSYAAFIMLGTIGFFSSLIFVRRIYSAIKCD